MKRLRLKDLGTFKTGLTYSPDNICEPNEGVLVLRSANIQDDILDLGDCVYVNNDIPSWMRVKKGDILICSRNGSANLVGKTAIINSDINATWGAFMMLLRTRYNSNYINYLLNIIIRREKARFSTSTINQLTNSMLGGIVVDIFEDAKEQQRIVEYLDAKTTEIDKKIELLGKKRDAYKRLKTATINHAVTRGLDEHVKLKDSGIERFGLIPEHWDVKRFKAFARTIKGKQCAQFEEKGNDMELILSVETLRQQNSSFPIFGIIPEKMLMCEEGDIVIIWDGAGVGELLRTSKGILSSTIAKIDVNERIVAKEYFWHWRYGIEYILKQMPTGMGIPHLNPTILNNLMFAIPPLSEQKQIAAYLDERCAKIDAAVTIIGKQIDALKRLKRSLINEVVTGKRMV